jgi:hypothetical protein
VVSFYCPGFLQFNAIVMPVTQQLVIQRERIAEGLFAARNSPQHFP